MTTYRLSPRFFSQYRQRMSSFIGLPIAGIFVYSFADKINRYPPVVILTSIILVSLIAAISLPLMLRSEFKKHRQAWANYELIQSEDSITRIQDGFERTQISRSEITKIIEVTDFGLTIIGANDSQIFVPKLLENYDLLREELAEWQAIEVQALWRNLTLCFTIAFLPWAVIFGIARIFQNKFLTAGSLAVYLVYFLVSMAALLRSNKVNRNQKRSILIPTVSFSVLLIQMIVMLIVL